MFLHLHNIFLFIIHLAALAQLSAALAQLSAALAQLGGRALESVPGSIPGVTNLKIKLSDQFTQL